MFTMTCLICGKKFQSKAHNAKHCSRDCKLEAKRRRWAASHEPLKIYRKTCVMCGKTFESRRAQRKYCSDECYKSAGRMRKRIERSKHQKKKVAKVRAHVFRGLCSVCGANDVPVVECLECGYLACRKCRSEYGICNICSGVLFIPSIIAK